MFGTILLATLPGCGIVENFQNLGRQIEIASTIIENEVGTKPRVGWRWENGILKEVNVYFEQLNDESITLARFKKSIKEAMDKSLEEQPKQLLIVINANE